MGKVTRALISVSHKEGVLDFAKGIAKLGIEILSTGGTAKLLRDGGVQVKDVSEFTGFPGDARRQGEDAPSQGARRPAGQAEQPRAREADEAARHRAHRPRGREPLSLRADRGQARLHARGRHREHRYRRPDHAAVGGQELYRRGRGGLAPRLRPGARRDPADRRGVG